MQQTSKDFTIRALWLNRSAHFFFFCASTTFYKAVTRYLFPTIVRYIPPSVVGTGADFSLHKGRFGEAAIQHCLKYVAFAPSDDARVTVCEKVQARWNSERKAGLIYFARIPFRADFQFVCIVLKTGKFIHRDVPTPQEVLGNI